MRLAILTVLLLSVTSLAIAQTPTQRVPPIGPHEAESQRAAQASKVGPAYNRLSPAEAKRMALANPNDCAGLAYADGLNPNDFALRAAYQRCRIPQVKEELRQMHPEPDQDVRQLLKEQRERNQKVEGPKNILGVPDNAGTNATDTNNIFALPAPSKSRKIPERDIFALDQPGKSAKTPKDPLALTSASGSSKSYWNGGPGEGAPVGVTRLGDPLNGRSVDQWKVESGQVDIGVTRLGDPLALKNESSRLKQAGDQLAVMQQDRERREQWAREEAERARLAQIQRDQEMAALRRQQQEDALYYAERDRQRAEQARARQKNSGPGLLDLGLAFGQAYVQGQAAARARTAPPAPAYRPPVQTYTPAPTPTYPQQPNTTGGRANCGECATMRD